MARLTRRLVHHLGELARPDRLLIAALAVLATVPATALFGSPRFLVVVGGAVLVAMVASVRCADSTPARSIVVAVVAFVLYEVFVVFHGEVPVVATVDDLATIWSGVSSSVHGLLGAPVPSEPDGSRLTIPVAIAYVAAFAGGEIATRTRPPTASDPGLATAPGAPALVAFGITLVMTGGRAASVLIPIGMLVGIIVLTVWRVRHHAKSEPGSRTGPTTDRRGTPHLAGLTWVLVVGASAVAGVVVASHLPFVRDDDRFDPRHEHQAPIDLADDASPLSRIAPERARGSTPVFSIQLHVEGASTPPTRIRAVALDTYDGVVWGTSASWSRAGSALPPPTDTEGASVPTATVAQEVVLTDGYRSQFLPALDRPVSVTAPVEDLVTTTGLRFDRVSGVVIDATDPDRSKQGVRYEITASVPRYDQVDASEVPFLRDASTSPEGRTPDDIPPAIREWALALRRTSPLATAEAIQAELRRFAFDPDAVPGHSLGRLEGALAGRRGTDEQLAALFALAARIVGVPSRVALGYVLPPMRDGERTDVGASSIRAWVEVHLDGVGWMTFDGTDTDRTSAEAPPTTGSTNGSGAGETPTGSAVTAPPVRPLPMKPVIECDPAVLDCSTVATERVWWPALLVTVVVALPLLVVIGRGWRRHRRRTRGGPVRRAMGAWWETLDRLAAHGLPVSPTLTAAEQAQACAPVAGDRCADRISVFAPLLDDALYAPDDPPEHLAARAWDAADGVVLVLRERSGALARVRAAFDPRPLVRRRGGHRS